MAFTPETFVLCSKFNLFKAHANLWIYSTGDTLEECLAEHYFQPRLNLKNQDSPEVGDVIQCIVEHSKIAYLKIVAKTEKPYYITVARTFLENEAEILEEITALQLEKASKDGDFVTEITDENLGITQTEQEELESKIDLAANSGRMITEQGVWYAKMYAATVAPAAEDGTNYADFSQVDGQGNPVIVTYNRVNGAWVQDQTITPPAEYDGYVPVTSKIWDIPEQAGQQGGRVLWNHQSKEFTPYPQIVSFENINVTGNSTVDMPQNPGTNQIVNKNYVDEAIAAIPTPTVDIKQSIDAEIVGTLTVADNGDVSGFGNSNYLLFPGDLDMTGVNSFEIGVAFTLKLDESVIYLLSENPVSTLSDKHLTFMTQSTGLRFDINDGSNYQTLEGTTRLLRNTKYYAKLTYDGTNYTLSLSTDGINYTTEATAVAQYIPGKITYEYLIGRASSLIEYLHLSDYYIKKNGILVWQGLGDPGLHQRVSKAEVVGLLMPDYANGVSIATTVTSYTAPSAGWFYAQIGPAASGPAILVNGVQVIKDGLSNVSGGCGHMLPVSENDVITWTVGIYEANFFPCKGA